MRSIVIGLGEVGRSLASVLAEGKREEVFSHDKVGGTIEAGEQRLALIATEKPVGVIHICFPYSPEFVDEACRYIRLTDAPLVIIHSTVPVGTTRRIQERHHGANVVHSPIHGQHPHLARGIRTFLKYVGGTNEAAVEQALGYFMRHGIKAYPVSSPEASEVSKLLCTLQYGWQIVICKEIAAICERYGVPFDEAYAGWNREYNRAYQELHPTAPDEFKRSVGVDVRRPILHPTPGPIGGHCVIPNANLLEDFWLAATLIERNRDYAGRSSQTPIPAGHFRCDNCKRLSPLGDDGAAIAEMKTNFGNLPIEDRAMVCDECYATMRPNTSGKSQ